jgi:Fe-S cluster biogenesis protein NfuA
MADHTRPTTNTTPHRKWDEVAGVIRQLRPAIQGDGGDIELVDIGDDGTVSVRLHGACIGCPSAALTLKLGVEQSLRDAIPEVTQVVCL